MARAVELYLIRHGLAEARGPDWPDDAKRPLTPRGVARLQKAARGLVALGVELDAILTSPLVRARQTADLVAAAFHAPPPVVTAEGLAPGAPRARLDADLERQARRSRLALVGHEPDIGELAGRLAGLRPLAFKKGAVCRIDLDALPPAEPGTLRWFVTSRILRALAR